jgi:1,2-diacylglycerol 3-beta-galactosyltransferase
MSRLKVVVSLIFLTFNFLVATLAISFNCATAHVLGQVDLQSRSKAPRLDDDRVVDKVATSLVYDARKETYGDQIYHNATVLMNETGTDTTTEICNFIRHSGKLLKLKGGASSEKRKVLILMSDTGGGHRSSAQAIDQALSELFPGKVSVDIVDIWTDFAAWPFNRFVPSYRFMAKHPLIWRVFYAYGRFPPTKLFTEIMSRSTCYENFRRAIERSDPDMVVSVHPLCQHIPIPIIKKMNKVRSKGRLHIPFVTVVTDLGGAHPTWFNKGCDLCFVPSEAVRQEALKSGIPKDKIVLHGLPVRPSFWKASRSKNELRDSLGLKKEAKTVLVMGGGDGVGGLSNIALEMGKKLGDLKEPTQMIVVCGHNTDLVSQLKAKSWPSNMNAVIKGFLNNVDEYMGASDCLVTKAGPGTIAEAMIRGLPVVLSSFLPGQVFYTLSIITFASVS